MKKAMRFFSVLGIIAMLLQSNFQYVAAARGALAPELATTPPVLAASGPARLVKFDHTGELLENLSPREQADQIRDWLLLTAINSLGLTAEAIRDAVFDLPATRHGYLRSTANFEYGETRSSLIGSGKAVALVPVSGDAARADRLVHIADEHRKNTGGIPATLVVFEYKIDLNSSTALLTPRGEINGPDLFTPQHGYYQRRVSSVKDLEDFMSRVEDLTFAQADGNALLLGGRKLQRRYSNIRVEDVAAIWQSEDKIYQRDSLNAEARTFNDKWKKKWDEWDVRRKRILTYGGTDEQVTQLLKDKALLEAANSIELKTLEEKLDAAAKQQIFVRSSGFSLDPDWDYEGLRRIVVKYTPALKEVAQKAPAILGQAHIAAATTALANRKIVPYLELLDKLKKSSYLFHQLLYDEIAREGNKMQFQAARYDGDLQGTEAGMVLFYTDLLAKLWSSDIFGSAPDHQIREFKNDTLTQLSPIFEKESQQFSSCRLWFGPNDKGFQISGNDHRMLFARRATRIYAASSNPLRPGSEVPPDPFFSVALDWWDDHYEEVARYEPQYERLNEIMKWGLLIGWLNNADKGHLLGFLKSTPVNRSNWFPEWAPKQRDLKFQQWEKIGFFDRGFKGTKTEALPILYSQLYPKSGSMFQISGGVSLPGKDLFKGRPPLPPKPVVSEVKLRSNLIHDPKTGSTANTLRTFDGASYSFNYTVSSRPSVAGKSPAKPSVTAAAKPSAYNRSYTADLGKGVKTERTFAKNAEGLSVESRVAGVDHGQLNIKESGSVFELGWSGRALDQGLSLSRRLSRASNPKLALARDPAVKSAVRVGDEYLAELTGSNKWVVISEAKGTTTPAAAGKARVAALEDSAISYDVKWMEPAAAKARLAQPYVGLELVGIKQPAMMQVASAQAPRGTIPVEIKLGQTTLRGQLEPKTGTVHFRSQELPPAHRQDAGWLRRQLTADELGNLARRKPDLDGVIRYEKGPAPSPEGRLELLDRYAAAQRHGDVVKLADELLAQSKTPPLGKDAQARVWLHKGLAELAQGKVVSGRQTLGRALGTDPKMLDELAARFRDGSVYPGGTTARLKSEAGGYIWEYQTNSPLRGRSLTSADSYDPKNATIFIEDSPSLNRLDWSPAARHKTLAEITRGDFAEVIDIGNGGIGGWIPPKTFTGGGAGLAPPRKFVRAPEPSREPVNYSVPRFHVIPCEDQNDNGKCDDLERQSGDTATLPCLDKDGDGVCDLPQERIYIVRLKPESGQSKPSNDK